MEKLGKWIWLFFQLFFTFFIEALAFLWDFVWETVTKKKHGLEMVLFFGGLIFFTIGFQLPDGEFAYQLIKYSVIAVLGGFFLFVFRKT